MRLASLSKPVVASGILIAAVVAATQSPPWVRQSFAQVSGKAAASKPQPAADARAEDRAAIKALMASFAQAFEAADAKALAAHWTSEGEYQNDAGVRVDGRDALEKAFARLFATMPDAKAEGQGESLRFLSKDSALAEGRVAVRRGPAEPLKSSQYNVVFIREGSKWLIGQMRESSVEEDTIEDLGWLIGEWKSAGDEGAEIRTTYTWDGDKKFIQGKFALQEKSIGFGGTQIIGVDPTTGEVHSWTFESSGGVGEADWTRDGDQWVLDVVGTMPDGRVLSETNVLTRINENTFTWQSIDRALDDTEVPDLPPVKVTRVQP